MATRTLVITLDVIAARMAGPAIRAWELAHQLAAAGTVTLASKFPVDRTSDTVQITTFADDPRTLYMLAQAADVLVIQGYVLAQFPRLAQLGKYLVVDLYDPLIFESYPLYAQRGQQAAADQHREHLLHLDAQMLAGDFFICATERQRDMWLGRLCALGRLTPAVYAADPSLRRVIDRVPFGLPVEPPQPAAEPVLRGVFRGIGPADCVLLWGGGLWDWFDPLTLILAVARLAETRSDIKLFFMGAVSPNPDTPAMAMAARAHALAAELGVLGHAIFFSPGWLPYEARGAYLLEADAAVSAHFDTIETRFAFRTRLLDALWAGLPILTTGGDALAELVETAGLGAVLPPGDVDAWVAAIATFADSRPDRPAMRARVQQAAVPFQWPIAAAPLVAYCRAPYHQSPGLMPYIPPRRSLTRLLRKVWGLWREDGAGAVFDRIQGKLGR